MNSFYPNDPKTTWRGVTVCTDMVPALDALAKAVGDGIYVRPISGFGSYQSGSTASGTIAIRGGHIDFDLESVPSSKWEFFETKARQMGWNAVRRYRKWYSKSRGRWLTGSWQNHLHCTRFGDPHLSPLAISQQRAMLAGMNGLANDNDPLTGYRGTLFGQTFEQYLKRVAGTVISVGLTVVVAGVQRASGVTADGSWGPVTEAALEKVRKAKGPKSAVVAIQKALDTTPDGVWGPKTEAAYQKVRVQVYGPAKPAKTTPQKVRELQSALRITADGVLGRQTYDHVMWLALTSMYDAKWWNKRATATRREIQRSIGFTGKYIDGNLGPLTRRNVQWAVGGVQNALGITGARKNTPRKWRSDVEGPAFTALMKSAGYTPPKL